MIPSESSLNVLIILVVVNLSLQQVFINWSLGIKIFGKIVLRAGVFFWGVLNIFENSQMSFLPPNG